MAKVGTEQIRHKGSGKSIFSTINFYTKTKTFEFVDFPQEILDWNGSKKNREENISYNSTGKIVAKSYDECVKIGNEVFSAFYDQEINEEKIILYRIKVNNLEKNEIFNSPKLSIGIEFKTMYRIFIGTESFLSYENYENSKAPEHGTRLGAPKMTREDNSGFHDWNKIPHTEKTEIFFQNTTNTLSNLIDLIINFFGSDEKKLMENINSGKLLN